MSEMPVQQILDEVAATKRLTAELTLMLRRAVYRDGAINPVELESVFALDEKAEERDPEWVQFFVEAVTDFIVHQEEPRGYVSDANARWLVDRISRGGVVSTASELEALVKVLEKAETSPDWLSAFALDQVKQAVLNGDGPMANGNLATGRVNAEEAELMRRTLYAFGGGDNIAVTRAEAEILFDINDATAEADNDPAWNDLFVKAMASSLMAASGYQPPSREVALRHDAWLEEGPDAGDFLSRMAAAGLKGILSAYRAPSFEERMAERNLRFEEAAAAAERISADEAAWLAQRIGRDGELHENERAVLRFIAEESPNVHPDLMPLIGRAA